MQVNRSTSANQLRMGLLGAAVLVVALVATGIVYVIPFGKTTYAAELTDAQSIKAGDQVRVAGITVGSVRSLELGHKRVRMTFTVNRDIELGDRTTLQVRMLTVVGGHYLAVFPAGEKPLGDTTIPADRVQLPFSLVQTLQDSTAPLSRVDGDTLRENFAAMRDALAGSPDGLRRMESAMSDFVSILDRQKTEISRSLTVVDEYLTAIDNSRALLGTLVRQVGLLETAGLNKKAEIAEALRILGELLARIAAVEPAWRAQLQPLVDTLLEALPQLKDLGARLADSVEAITGLRERLQSAANNPAGPQLDQSGVTLPAPQLCVPVPGRGC